MNHRITLQNIPHNMLSILRFTLHSLLHCLYVCFVLLSCGLTTYFWLKEYYTTSPILRFYPLKVNLPLALISMKCFPNLHRPILYIKTRKVLTFLFSGSFSLLAYYHKFTHIIANLILIAISALLHVLSGPMKTIFVIYILITPAAFRKNPQQLMPLR